ncbi:MAG: zinc-dependent metalloprotease family protein [Rhodospirillales bacterium]
MRFKFLTLGVAFASFCNLGVIDAMAADLITPVTDNAAIKTEAPAPQTAAQQLVRVDADGLVAALSTSHIGAPVVLDLLPGVSVPLVLDRTDPAPTGMSAFAAHSPGDVASSATIVVNQGTVYAVINYKNATYEISYLSNGIHKISKINQDKFPGDKVIERTGPSLPPPSAESLKSTDVTVAATVGDDVVAPEAATKTIISVTILATSKASSHHPNWLSIAQAAITDANTTFSNSAVALTFKITSYANLTNYDETNKTFDQMLADLSAAPGIQSWRDSTKSDLVAFFRDDTGLGNAYCGLGYLPDPPSAATSAYAYSIVNISCAVGNHSYVHEAGHNMGLRHDRYVEGALGTLQSKYNYGFSNVAARVRTVMAYADYCSSQGVSCTRVAFLSNPNKKSNGGALGVKVGATNPAFNARRLKETKATIAAYR